MYENVPINLRNIMAKKNVGVRVLAKQSQLQSMTITNVRRKDGAQYVTPDIFTKLMAALEVSAEALMGEPECVTVTQLPEYLNNFISMHRSGMTTFSNTGLTDSLIQRVRLQKSDEKNQTRMQEAIGHAKDLNEDERALLGHIMGVRIVDHPSVANTDKALHSRESDTESDDSDAAPTPRDTHTRKRAQHLPVQVTAYSDDAETTKRQRTRSSSSGLMSTLTDAIQPLNESPASNVDLDAVPPPLAPITSSPRIQRQRLSPQTSPESPPSHAKLEKVKKLKEKVRFLKLQLNQLQSGTIPSSSAVDNHELGQIKQEINALKQLLQQPSPAPFPYPPTLRSSPYPSSGPYFSPMPVSMYGLPGVYPESGLYPLPPYGYPHFPSRPVMPGAQLPWHTNSFMYYPPSSQPSVEPDVDLPTVSASSNTYGQVTQYPTFPSAFGSRSNASTLFSSSQLPSQDNEIGVQSFPQAGPPSHT